MIIYEANKEEFFNHVRTNQISNEIKQNFIKKGFSIGNDREIASWNNSLNFMKNVLDSNDIPEDVYIAIEYKIPLSAKRIDFIISGLDQNNRKNIIIVELKQWQKVSLTNKDDMVLTYLNNKDREVLHPSYQALQYKYLLNSFNEELNSGNIQCFSCSYLHNMEKENNSSLIDITIFKYVNDCPVYFKEDYDTLQKKIIQLTKGGKGKEILYEVENGKIVPAKKLIDVVGKIISGSNEYLLIDSQKEIFAKIISEAHNENNVYIINGNPGTGKSVVAINLLSKLLSLKLNTIFSAPNAAYRNVIKKQLQNYCKETKEKILIDNLFKGSSSFFEAQENLYDWVIVDEAHRLKGKGTYMYKGENQVEDIIKASKNVVFFVDENQIIRNNDIGTNQNIIDIAKKYNKQIHYGNEWLLETQFRCSGSDGYINAIDNILQINETANFYLDDNKDYDFRICDTPEQMQSLIQERINHGNKNSRILAGFAWKWETKKKSLDELIYEHDIKIGNWSIPWNYNDSQMLWAIRDDGIMQAGCIHTCQGLEFDYCGVIIGQDLEINIDNNKLIANYDNYKDETGKKGLKNNIEQLTKLIKNIYKVLLTRGQKGTYVYICDDNLRQYFKKHIKNK